MTTIANGSDPATPSSSPEDAGAENGESTATTTTTTRERILDVALDLFTEKGYDRTSLREIAERLGFTKAALYYHFASKDDILLALHMRLHAFGTEAIQRLSEEPFSLRLWGSLLDDLLDHMLAQRKIFLFHERNQAALEKLHAKAHDAEHEDLQAKLRAILADPNIRLRDRVRMACSIGAVFGGMFMAGDAFAETSAPELGALLREAVHDLIEDADDEDHEQAAPGGTIASAQRPPAGTARPSR